MQDGVKVSAHAAVLASLPYFAAKLRGDWSGTDWNLNKKLIVHLPCPVNQNVVRAFLKCAYEDVQSLHQIESSDAPFLQVGFQTSTSRAKLMRTCRTKLFQQVMTKRISMLMNLDNDGFQNPSEVIFLTVLSMSAPI
jgi:hypothetical protein